MKEQVRTDQQKAAAAAIAKIEAKAHVLGNQAVSYLSKREFLVGLIAAGVEASNFGYGHDPEMPATDILDPKSVVERAARIADEILIDSVWENEPDSDS